MLDSGRVPPKSFWVRGSLRFYVFKSLCVAGDYIFIWISALILLPYVLILAICAGACGYVCSIFLRRKVQFDWGLREIEFARTIDTLFTKYCLELDAERSEYLKETGRSPLERSGCLSRLGFCMPQTSPLLQKIPLEIRLLIYEMVLYDYKTSIKIKTLTNPRDRNKSMAYLCPSCDSLRYAPSIRSIWLPTM